MALVQNQSKYYKSALQPLSLHGRCKLYSEKSPLWRIFIFNLKTTKAITMKVSIITFGPIHALSPNFRPIGSEMATKIEQIKNNKMSLTRWLMKMCASCVLFQELALAATAKH